MSRVLVVSLIALAASAALASPAAAQRPRSVAGEDVLAALVETYHQAMETKDEARLRDDLYRGPIPGENRRFIRSLFDRTEELTVSLLPREFEVDAEEAAVLVDCVLTFRHATTGEQRTADYTLRLIFERSAEGWRLKKFERA